MNSLSFKLFSCALVALIASACSSTDAPQQDSDEVINIEASQLVVTLNGADVQATSATLNLADNTITLAGVLPANDLVINITTSPSAEGITFEGSSLCTPSINPDARSLADILVSVRGSIINGIANIIVRTSQIIEQNRAMVGEWSLINKITYSGTYWDQTVESSPLLLRWDAAPNMELLMSQFGAALAYQNLKLLKLNDNATAEITYCPSPKMDMVLPNPDGTIPEPTHNNWVTTEPNQFFWFVKGDRLCLVPNIYKMLRDRLATIGGNNGDIATQSRAINRDQIDSIATVAIESINWMRDFAKQWAAPGLSFKYTLDGDKLAIYWDKEMLDPIIQLDCIFTFLQTKIDAIEDEDTAGMINMLLQFAGMQSITDLPDLWQNTNEFYLALNFCR